MGLRGRVGRRRRWTGINCSIEDGCDSWFSGTLVAFRDGGSVDENRIRDGSAIQPESRDSGKMSKRKLFIPCLQTVSALAICIIPEMLRNTAVFMGKN